MRESRLSLAVARLLELVYGVLLVTLILGVVGIVWLVVPHSAAVWEGLGAAIIAVLLYFVIAHRTTKN